MFSHFLFFTCCAHLFSFRASLFTKRSYVFTKRSYSSSRDEVSSRQKCVNSKRHFTIDRDDFIPGRVLSGDQISRVNTLLILFLLDLHK